MSLSILSADQVVARLKELNPKRAYRAMYSSLFGGVVVDPSLMVVPIDDHMVHRGDGVFEAIRYSAHKGPYLLAEHLERLERSASQIGLKAPLPRDDIARICHELPRIGKIAGDGMLRVFVARGPGDFSPSPYSTIGAQLYIVVMDFKPMPREKYSSGVDVMISEVDVKPDPFVQIKSCNYLPNVMMKKESLDKGFDFSIAVTREGFLAEGPTENFAIVDKDGHFLAPRFDYTLKGTTLVRAMELLRPYVEGGRSERAGLGGQEFKLSEITLNNLTLLDVQQAREVMMIGTTLAALPVRRIGEHMIGNGRPGPVTRALCHLLQEDMGVEKSAF